MTSILFVCTGNVFRSLTAEYALRQHIGGRAAFTVSSAGTEDDPSLKIRADVAAYLLSKGLDVTPHRRRLVSEALISGSEVVIAMSADHKQILRERYAINAPLFMEACGVSSQALLDVDDLFAPKDRHGPEAQRHIEQIIDTIIATTPRLYERICSPHGQF